MHQTIAIIVYGRDATEAREGAQEAVNHLTDGAHAPFDYGNILDVLPADSADAKEALDEAMESTFAEFSRAVDTIRAILASGVPNEELFIQHTEIDLKQHFRSWCRKAGEHVGSSVFLYDSDAEGITAPGHLEDALSRWRVLWAENPETESKYKDKAVWVATADVHC